MQLAKPKHTRILLQVHAASLLKTLVRSVIFKIRPHLFRHFACAVFLRLVSVGTPFFRDYTQPMEQIQARRCNRYSAVTGDPRDRAKRRPNDFLPTVPR